MTSVSRSLTGVMAAVGLAAVLASCKPASLPPSGGGNPRPTATATPAITTSPAASPSTTSSPTTGPTAPTSSPAAPPAPATTPPRTVPTTRPPTTSAPRPTTTSPAAPPPPATGTKADEVVRLTNVERSKAGCGPLAVDARLTAAAQGHSADMAQKNYFSHTSLDGRSFADRIRATGFPGTSIGENIAAGGTTAAQTVEMWMNSAGHRANMLNCSYTHIGVGYAEGGSYRYYWTQDFGRL
ncbi:CAP domain-containing protein [Pseudofrankia sp. BMG5.36]|uniref:CAP domain-containing protein n=1 Tax=Pseudofrankia sp. BMG5.36 TaxID=1834512 RepID=UPI0008D9AC10|nr:CAP domain-containing protein [Pseudofrankia sp. BMG5.36]OHV56794.1 serine protease [Pseudofrankia sp. BMG5.36]